jgi:hypothetical protein
MSKTRQYSILEWCELFGVEIIDNDGFRDLGSEGLKTVVPIDVFVNGICLCTINPIDRARYKHLDFLMAIL